MVTCPRGLAVGTCCAIQPSGAVFVQEMNACRAGVTKSGEIVLSRRVTISKMGGPIVLVKGEEPVKKAATDAQGINIRKVAWDLIQQTAANLRRERAGLTEAEAVVKTVERYPRLAELYSDGMRRGDPLEDLTPPAPVAVSKAGATKAEILETIQKRAAPIADAQKISKDQALLRVLETPEGKHLYQAYCDARA